MALDPSGALDDLSIVSDVVSRLGVDEKRKRNEMIRGGLADIGNFKNQYSDQINQSLQPTQQAQQPQTNSGISYLGNQYIPGQTSATGEWHSSTTPSGLQDYMSSLGKGQMFSPEATGGWWELGEGKNLVYDAPTAGVSGTEFNDVAPSSGGYRVHDNNQSSWKGFVEGILPIVSVLAPAFTAGLGSAMAGAGGASAGAGAGLGATAAELAIDAGALGGASTGALGAASLGTPGLFGAGGVLGTGLDLGSSLLNNGVSSFAKNMFTSGGDVKKSALSSLFGGVSGAAGQQLTSMLDPAMGEIASKMLGGAASGGISSLFNKNSPIAGSLMGATSGGLGAFLNSPETASLVTSPLSSIMNSDRKRRK